LNRKGLERMPCDSIKKDLKMKYPTLSGNDTNLLKDEEGESSC
jgi:hypothetical protein